MKLKSLLQILPLVIICGCNNFNNNVPTNKLGDINAIKKFTIQNWAISNPYYANSVANSDAIVKHNHLYTIGENEKALSFRKLIKNNAKVHTDSNYYRSQIHSRFYNNEYGLLKLGDILNSKENGFVYLAANIECEKTQEVVILFAGDDSYRITINGKTHEIIADIPDDYGALKYDKPIFTTLQKGHNHIIIKSTNWIKPWFDDDHDEKWNHIFHICSKDRYNRFYLPKEKNIIISPLIPLGYPIKLNPIYHPDDSIKEILVKHSITKFEINIDVFNHTLPEQIMIDTLKPGRYELIIRSKYNDYRQDFYYGDIYKGIDQYIQKCKSIMYKKEDVNTINSIEGLMKRYDLLKEHYKKYGFYKIHQVKNNHVVKTDSFCVVPIHSYELDKPDKVIVENIYRKDHQLADLNFFSNTSQPFIELTADPTTDEKLKWIRDNINDKENATVWYPDKIVKLEFDFSSTKPDLIQLVPFYNTYKLHVQKRFIFLHKKLSSIYHDLHQGTNPYVNKEGMQLISYISPVENQPRYFVTIAPENIGSDTSPRPLVVYTPMPMATHVPYLKGMALAYVGINEQIQFISNKTGYLAVKPDARTHTYTVTSPIALNEVLYTINEVKKYYAVDTSRIFIVTGCGGTDLALNLATKYPDKFRAIGFANSVINLNPNNKWLEANLPANLIQNLSNTPIKFIQGELDDHSPIESVQIFTDYAKQLSMNNISLEIIKGLSFEANPYLEIREELYDFFNKASTTLPRSVYFNTAFGKYNKSHWLQALPFQKGTMSSTTAHISNPGLIEITTNLTKELIINFAELQNIVANPLTIRINNVNINYNQPLPKADTFHINNDGTAQLYQPPILEALGESFILVEGTIGDKQNRDFNKSVAASFTGMWKREYYSTCKRTTDRLIGSENILNDHLVLIGNQYSNSVIKKIYSKLPLEILPNGLIIGTKTYGGTKLGYWFVYPNPLNPEKNILLIGTNSVHNNYLFRETNPAADAIYGYEIYDYSINTNSLVDLGTLNIH